MKISLNWLKDYVDVELSPEDTGEILSDLGFPIEEIIELDDDTVLDVEVTSNRGDCLSHIGVARELAVATGKELRLPEVKLDYSDKDTQEFVDVTITEPELCNRYMARYIEGAKVGPTPEWMKKRLEAIGVRSVNNVVDATNYAMMELGQPCHAFDYDKLEGQKIIVRKAIAGERIVSIDSTKCDLGVEMLVIADERVPVAIAGVMGGLDTEVSDATTNILLEDAHFDPVSVRTTARGLVMGSESSFRFERHVDVEMIEWASQRTAQLIQMVAGGKVAKGFAQSYPVEHKQEKVQMRLERLNKLMGFEFDVDQVKNAFDRLGLAAEYDAGSQVFTCTVPTWRHDISREVDLIEEAARVIGYDKIPSNEKIFIKVAAADKHQKVLTKIGGYLNACGFYETLGITFTDEKTAKLFAGKDSKAHLGVKDVTRKSANLLRQTLVGNLVATLQSNHNVGNNDCRFFEIANTFELEGAGANLTKNEKTKLAMVCDGDIQLLRGAFEGLVRSLCKTSTVEFKAADVCWAKTGAQILLDGEVVGVAGSVSDKVAKKYGFKDSRPVALEVELDPLIAIEGREYKIKHLPKFPSVTRDISVIVEETTTWDDIEKCVVSASPKELEKVDFVGIYRGKPIPANKKSLTLTMTFRDEDGTLRHEIVDGFQEAILGKLKSEVKAELRTV